MAKTKEIKKVSFATDPIGKLIVRFAIPCVIALVVNALYNIVDQIFIGWGVGYLGNGATNIVFPITIVALAFAVLVGDGGAAYLSLKLGEGDSESVKKGLGNAIVMVTAPGVLILIRGDGWAETPEWRKIGRTFCKFLVTHGRNF